MRAMVVCGLLVFSVPAWSYTILGTPNINVGSEDEYLTGANVNSGDANELAWVKGYLSTQGWTAAELAAMTLIGDKEVFNFVRTIEDPYIIASPLGSAPEYFYLKLGQGNLPPGAFNHILFRNVAELNYAVVDLTDTEYTIVNIGGISHLGRVGSTSIPEPGTMMLLGSGLVGLAWWGQKKFRK